jgi:hypothetical protein
MTHLTREDWLTQAIAEVRPIFSAEGLALAPRIRVACGFPAHAARNGRLGECHASAASADQHYEILISPVLDDKTRVFDVLIHELCHTLPGCMNHGLGFGKAAFAMGLEAPNGKWSSTVAGKGFADRYRDILDSLGEYPHAALSVGKKTQSTRMLKAVCPSCGYSIRLTRRHADKGLPICSLDNSQFVLV